MTENRSRANIFIEQNRFSYIDILRGIGIFFRGAGSYLL